MLFHSRVRLRSQGRLFAPTQTVRAAQRRSAETLWGSSAWGHFHIDVIHWKISGLLILERDHSVQSTTSLMRRKTYGSFGSLTRRDAAADALICLALRPLGVRTFLISRTFYKAAKSFAPAETETVFLLSHLNNEFQ